MAIADRPASAGFPSQQGASSGLAKISELVAPWSSPLAEVRGQQPAVGKLIKHDWLAYGPDIQIEQVRPEAMVIVQLGSEFPDLASRDNTAQLFLELAEVWENEVAHLSTLEEIVQRPEYQRIIRLGDMVIPLIFDRFKYGAPKWFWALRSIAGYDAARDARTSAEATAMWKDWGAQQGYLTSS